MPQARTRVHDDAFDQRRPPLSRRRSPNQPNRYCSFNIAAPLPNRSAANRITPNHSAGTLKPQPESIRRTQISASTSAFAGATVKKTTIFQPSPRLPEAAAAGGLDDEDVALGRNSIERADGRIETLHGTDRAEMAPGDVFVIETPGGGGFGEPG